MKFDRGLEKTRWLAGIMVFAVLGLVGVLANPYIISLLTIVLLFTFLGQSWNLMLGIGGQLSIGHALFVGLGAYSVGVLDVKYGISPWVGLLTGMILAGSVGAVIAWLSFRFRSSRHLFRAAHDCRRRIREDHVQWLGVCWCNAGVVLSCANRRD
ncbi:ABC transporter permease subunit [Bradyrhizobium sp. JR3.5]